MLGTVHVSENTPPHKQTVEPLLRIIPNWIQSNLLVNWMASWKSSMIFTVNIYIYIIHTVFFMVNLPLPYLLYRSAQQKTNVWKHLIPEPKRYLDSPGLPLRWNFSKHQTSKSNLTEQQWQVKFATSIFGGFPLGSMGSMACLPFFWSQKHINHRIGSVRN